MKKKLLFIVLLLLANTLLFAQNSKPVAIAKVAKDTLQAPAGITYKSNKTDNKISVTQDSLQLSDSITYIPDAKVVKLKFEMETSQELERTTPSPERISNDWEEEPDPNNPDPNNPGPGVTIDAGRTTGLLEVSPSGGASYTVPISVPPGINNISPKISITYNSQSGNGVAGYGWNIGGLSAITRIPATKFIDGIVGKINNGTGDKFALDGQRLILKTGTYGAEGAEYSTENYSNIKVVSHGYGANPTYFEVFYPDGSKANYGSTYGAVSTMQYALSYLENPQGLRINYVYDNYNGNPLITQINYGSTGTGVGINQINFIYKNRQHKEQSYNSGSSNYSVKILSEINVYGNGNNYRNYSLTHDVVAGLGYERLTSINELNGDKTHGFEPINFQYNYSYPSILPSGYAQIGLSGMASNNSDVITGDFTGNGTLDFVLYPKTKNKYWLLRDPDLSSTYNFVEEVNTGYFEEIFPVNWLTYSDKLFPGAAMALVKNNGTGNVKFQIRTTAAYSSGFIQYEKTWDNAPTTYPYYSECLGDEVYDQTDIPKKYLSGDFNGDGLTDLIAITLPYSQIDYEYQVQCPDPWDYDCCEKQYSYVNTASVYLINLDRRVTTNFVDYAGALSRPLSGNNTYAADFNGDGKTDIIQVYPGGLYVYEFNEFNQLTVLKNQTDSKITTTLPALLGDYNGDGKIDIIFPTASSGSQNNVFATFLSDGKAFVRQDQTLPFRYTLPTISGGNIDATSLIPTDINNDGKTDFLVLNTKTYNNTTQGSISLTAYHNMGASLSNGAPVFQYATFRSQTTYVKHRPIPLFLSSQQTNFRLEFGLLTDDRMVMFNFEQNARNASQLISTYQDGVSYGVSYKDLISGTYDEGIPLYEESWNQTYPFVDIHSAPGLKVVNKLTKTFNWQTTQQVFGYKGAVSHADGLGFLGFEQLTKSNWHINSYDNNVLYNISVNDIGKRGAPKQSFTSKSIYFSPSILNTNAPTPSYDGNGDPIISNSPNGINDGASLTDYINRTDYVYQTTLAADKVFTNVPVVIHSKDLLSGTNTISANRYDSFFNVTKEISDFSGQGSKKTVVTYDNNTGSSYYIGRPLKKETFLINGAETYNTEEQYTYTGFLPTEIKRKGNGTAFVTENLQYDSFGNLTRKGISVPNLAERASSMQYDASGRFVTKTTDVEGLETNYTYDIYNGNVLTVTNPFGQVNTSYYDDWGRLSQNTDYLGNSSYRSYSQSGYDILTVESNDEGGLKYSYTNALGQTIESVAMDVLGQYTGKAFEYDAYGREIRISEPALGGFYTQWNEKIFDSYGRLSQATAFTGKTTSITYNGLTTTVNDGTKTIITTKNALDQVVTSQDPGGIIAYTYFANGNLKSSSYGGAVQTIAQDGWGRKTQLTDPSAGVYNYTYNDFGEALTENTPKGTTTYTYDDYGKIVTKKIIGDLTNMDYLYAYDNSSKLLNSLTLTSTVTNDNNNSTYTYTYDGYKRLIGKVENNPYATFTKNLTYDSFGRPAEEQTIALDKASGKTVSKTTLNNYIYGGLSSITDMGTAETIQQVAGLNARGQVTLAYQADYNIKQSNTYDQYGFVEEIKTNRITGALGELMRLNYTFDAQRGNLTSRSNSVFSWNENFLYDSQDRLTDFNDNNGNFNQAYSSNGSITTNSKLGTYTYNGYQQTGLSNITQTAMDHYNDRRLQKISYNAFKSPVEIAEQGKEKISFWYNAAQGRAHRFYGDENIDPLQRRLRKHYSEDGSVEITKDMIAGTTSFVLYIAGDAYSAPAIWKEDYSAGTLVNSQMYYLHRDYLGSILLITDNQGASKERRHFDAWGNIVKLTDGIGNTLTDFVILDRGYTGHEHLTKVGLVHMNGRLYDPLLHRFLSPDNFVQDPSNTQNYNRYGYVLNNPLSHVDPSGEFIFAAFTLAVIIKAVIVGAAVGAVTYTASIALSNGGFNNWNWGQFAKSVGIGAVSGFVTAGIGAGFGDIGKFGHELLRGLAHGFSNGGISELTGGSFLQGFASGALGSLAGSGFQAWGGDFAKSAVGTIGYSAVAGGVGAELTGGDFWRGAVIGATVAGLNHVQETAQQRRIARTAEKYVGSKDWSYETSKDNFDSNTNKCNKFVYDVTDEAGASPGTPNGNWLKIALGGDPSPPTAGQWADPAYKIPNWKVVNRPQRGDVAAYSHRYSDATGHVAIMKNSSYSIGANAHIVRVTDFGSNSSHLPPGSNYVYRRYVGK